MAIPVLTDTNTAMATTSRAASAIPNRLRPSKIKLRNRVEKAIRSGGLEFTRTAYQERGANTLASWLCLGNDVIAEVDFGAGSSTQVSGNATNQELRHSHKKFLMEISSSGV
jgi:hypothetical protein